MPRSENLQTVKISRLNAEQYAGLVAEITALTDTDKLGVVIPDELRPDLVVLGLALIDREGNLKQSGKLKPYRRWRTVVDEYNDRIDLARNRLPISAHRLAVLIEESLHLRIDSGLLPLTLEKYCYRTIRAHQASSGTERCETNGHKNPRVLPPEVFGGLTGWHPDVYRLRRAGLSYKEIAEAISERYGLSKDFGVLRTVVLFYNQALSGEGLIGTYCMDALDLAALGLSNPEIARELGTSYGAVKKMVVQARMAGIISRRRIPKYST